VQRPRILLVPSLTEVEWKIKPELEEWADVISFDAPGVGGDPTEPVRGSLAAGIVARGLEEVDRRGWERFVLVGDEVGAAQAIRLAGTRPQAIQALALGHPARSMSSQGPAAPINQEIVTAVVQLARTDFRSYVRALTHLTQNAYDDEQADRYMQRVRQSEVETYLPELFGAEAEEGLSPILSSLRMPILLVEHRGCLMWTRDGWDEVVALLPQARTESMLLKPSASPEFAELLRELCAEVEETQRG
jgi:pimeloyl-ACP methyl ester carboxylesterase